jgi:hypothetical protein
MPVQRAERWPWPAGAAVFGARVAIASDPEWSLSEVEDPGDLLRKARKSVWDKERSFASEWPMRGLSSRTSQLLVLMTCRSGEH